MSQRSDQSDVVRKDEEKARVFSLQVDRGQPSVRMDVWLKENILSFSRKTAQRHCDQGRVRQGGQVVKKSTLVEPGARVEVELEADDAARAAPDVSLEIAFENEDLVVVNKPAHLPCAALVGRTQGTLAGALIHRYPQMIGVGYGRRDPGLLHRLDTETSGLVVAAKSQSAFDKLRQALVRHEWDKRYLAVVDSGRLADSGECHLPLGPHPKNKRAVQVDLQRGRACSSSYRILSRGSSVDLVEVVAKTAYRHQVRAHMAALGAPLLGDLTYGGRPAGLAPRHALHASYIAIPTAGLEAVTCPLPEDMRALLDVDV